ncbi:MAG: SCO family protein [Ignavibacteriales bacterium]|nr:SCO family protein [Ignavibacteriales bacterium]
MKSKKQFPYFDHENIRTLEFTSDNNIMKWQSLLLIILFWSCKEKFPVIEELGSIRYNLVNQNNQNVVFPDFVKNKIVVMNYIFTNCPDICPLSTNNMRLIQEGIKKENIKNVHFVSLSFDPKFDTPDVLKKFAGIRNLDLSNWVFLTGEKSVTDSIIKKVGVWAVPNDSSIFRNGRKIYYYVHTDRIQLIDADGKIRKNYKGSTINVNEIVADIKNLQ